MTARADKKEGVKSRGGGRLGVSKGAWAYSLKGACSFCRQKKTVNCVVCYALTRCCCHCRCRRKIQTYLIDTCENHASDVDVDSGKVNELCYWLACAAMRYVLVTMQRSPPLHLTHLRSLSPLLYLARCLSAAAFFVFWSIKQCILKIQVN